MASFLCKQYGAGELRGVKKGKCQDAARLRYLRSHLLTASRSEFCTARTLSPKFGGE